MLNLSYLLALTAAVVLLASSVAWFGLITVRRGRVSVERRERSGTMIETASRGLFAATALSLVAAVAALLNLAFA